MTSNDSGLCFLDAVELARMVREREVSAVELMTAFLERIECVNPTVNAIPTRVDDDLALESARKADELLSRGQTPGPLHGLPHAVKDLASTAGIRTTQGSRIYRDFIPETDDLFVERLKAAGAIIIGKTNVPEFGAGSHTYNEVFGATLNPYDLTKTSGGSSGGAAAALATGMVPLADGSDLGGSLRNPASFCNVVGFRPSPGRVPIYPTEMAWNTLAVVGPMGRTVRDAALLLSVMAGPDPRVPISIEETGASFNAALGRDLKGVRLAWSSNLGRYPVEPEVTEVCQRALPILESLGCVVEAAEPDFTGADETFQTLRAWMFAQSRGEDLRRHRDLIKETVIWNVEKGMSLTGSDIARAETKRTELFQRVLSFMNGYDFLILPVSQVAPFPVETDWVRQINGIPMQSYIDWMASCYAITLTGLPAISVPCGFTADGLPVGLQIVGRHHRDYDVLQLAYAFEQATGYGRRRPTL
ncbi:MAG: amidase [Acidobacteriota bacterium]